MKKTLILFSFLIMTQSQPVITRTTAVLSSLTFASIIGWLNYDDWQVVKPKEIAAYIATTAALFGLPCLLFLYRKTPKVTLNRMKRLLEEIKSDPVIKTTQNNVSFEELLEKTDRHFIQEEFPRITLFKELTDKLETIKKIEETASELKYYLPPKELTELDLEKAEQVKHDLSEVIVKLRRLPNWSQLVRVRGVRVRES